MSATERATVTTEIIEADNLLRYFVQFVDAPEAELPHPVAEAFSRTPLVSERPPDVLHRWWAVFSDDIALVHEVRNRIVHQAKVTDAELKLAHSLGAMLTESTRPAAPQA